MTTSPSPFSKFPPCPFWGKVGIGVCLLLTACSPKLTPVPVVEHHTDTCYIHDLQLDSVYFYESEQLRSGLKTTEKGLSPSGSFTPDTVVITRIKEHYRIQHDTIRTSHCDTIPIIRTQEVVREVPKPVPRFYKWCTGLFISLVILFLARIAIRFYLLR